MTNRPSIKRIPVGKLGSVNIDLPVLTFGWGKPKRVITTGLHGGEESGLWILSELLPKLPARLPGQLVVLPSASPLTQAFKTRFSPVDFDNPNRAFPGSERGNLSARTAQALKPIIQGADCLIDLHCFGQAGAFTGVFVKVGRPSIQKRSLNLLAQLEPEVVWLEPGLTPDGRPSVSALDGFSRTLSVPSCTLEMPKPDQLSTEMKNRIVSGLLNLLTQPKAKAQLTAPILLRQDVRADQAGFFVPIAQPLDPIKADSLVGRLYQMPDLKPKLIRSELAGRLFLINRPGLVRTGDKLYAVGRPARL